MSSTEPEITQIAAVFADRLPRGAGAEPLEAKEAWRSTLRYARKAGVIDELAQEIADTDPSDRVIQALADEVRR